MTAFEARSTPLRVILLALLAAGMTALSFWVTRIGSGDLAVMVVGYVGVAFFGFGTAVIASRLGSLGVEVRIDERGVYVRRYRPDPIPFEAIRGAGVLVIERQKMLALHLHAPDEYPAAGRAARALAAANAGMGYGDLGISVTGTDRSFEELLAAFDAWGRASGDLRAR